MILLPVIALVIGFLIPFLFKTGPITNFYGLYIGVACLAGLDSVLGGIRSGLEGKFHNDVFVTGFIANVIIALFLAWLGDQIGLDLFLVAVLVMGGRIYTNLSLIRRFVLTKWKDTQERVRLKEQQAQQAQSNV
jgi:small basic protein